MHQEDFFVIFLIVIILVGTLFSVLAAYETRDEVAKLRIEIAQSRMLAGVK